jgi:diguanylate cyclase
LKTGKMKNESPLILVVDDFRTTLLMVTKVLQKKGYRVAEALNGLEALAFFEKELPDMVLMDIEMPEMDGLTACGRIKSMPADRQCPVLIFTGMGDEKSVENAFNAGADDFIIKPINFEELIHRIKRLIKLKEMEDVIQYQSYYDRLTGLPNRSLFQDRLKVALNQVQNSSLMLAVIMIDIQDFKSVNDAFGYEQGDLLLKGIAKRIQSCTNENITLARLDGDRFALLIPQIKAAYEAAPYADRVIETFTKAFMVNTYAINLNCSMGLSFYPTDGTTAHSLLINSEAAMYRATEKAGSGYSYYNQEMNKKTLERLSLVSELHKALKKSEFIVYYQPQINISTGQINAAESLLRWQNPELGPVTPAQFLPMAEETGLILPIGAWALREACLWGRTLKDNNYPSISIGVNLSPLQFQQEDLVEMIGQILADTAFDPTLLKLEITESLAVKDLEYTNHLLNRLKIMGIKISIDDFGTGYSSLNSLKNLPFDELKIDMSFIRDIVKNKKDKVIVEAIIALGRGLNVNLVAEGVETKEQLLILKEMGCDQAQGFLFSKPVPADTFNKMIHH